MDVAINFFDGRKKEYSADTNLSNKYAFSWCSVRHDIPFPKPRQTEIHLKIMKIGISGPK